MKKAIIYLCLMGFSLAAVLLIGCAPSLDVIKAEEFVGRHWSDAWAYCDQSWGSFSIETHIEALYRLRGEEPPRSLSMLPPDWRIYTLKHYHPEDPKFESCTIEFLADENDYIQKILNNDCKKR